MEQQLRDALEAADDKKLQRLVKQLDSNFELTVGGYDKEFNWSNNERTQSVAHHVTCKMRSRQSLQMLIERVGADCLSSRNEQRETTVHCAAMHQDETWLELICSFLEQDCLDETADSGRTVAHYAARNRKTNSSLKWLIKQRGSHCLTVPDKNGHTPVHHAAQYQGADSLEMIKRELGTDCFLLKGGFWNRTAIHSAACNKDSNASLKWFVKELGRDCLIVPDKRGDTPVHLAAQRQGVDSLEMIKRELGTDCFLKDGSWNRTAIHFAASNIDSNASLKWFVKELGRDCLTVPDRDGDTPVHFAALYHGVDSLQFLADELGPQIFSLKNNQGQTLADCLEKDSDSDRESSKRAWIESQLCQKQLPQPQPSVQKQQEPAASPEALDKSVLDPGFTTWDFVLDGGKKQVIGACGFGTVYKALTDRFQTVAVKIVKLTGAKQSAELEKAIELERQGIEVLRKIRHRNIVQFLKCERAKDGRFCIFTELVSGHSLSELMERQKKPFPESGVKNFSRQICSGLNFLHNQSPTVLHRDIKCSNIMLTHEGVIKLIDFGLAKVIENTCGFSDNPSGTWHFMAPEQFGCDEACQYSVKSDVWAFGCTVFEMTEMQPPNGNLQRHQIPMLRHKNKDMPQISDQMSEALRDFYRRCVVWEPQQRADTEELLRHRFLIE